MRLTNEQTVATVEERRKRFGFNAQRPCVRLWTDS